MPCMLQLLFSCVTNSRIYLCNYNALGSDRCILLDFYTQHGWTPLIAACSSSATDVVKELADFANKKQIKLDYLQKTKKGETAISLLRCVLWVGVEVELHV